MRRLGRCATIGGVPSDRARIERVARERFGFEDLRPGQAEAIDALVAWRDTLTVMSTGHGKSAIYDDGRVTVRLDEVGYRTLAVAERGRLPADEA